MGFPYSPNETLRNPLCLQWNGIETIKSQQKALKANIAWNPPSPNILKWNVDASVNTLSARSAIGGVLRSHSGNFSCIFSSPIPFMEINSAEIHAFHRAIRISLSSEKIKSSKIILESDSSNAVLWCNADNGGPWNLNFQLNFIRNARKNGLDISIVHKSRSANFVADAFKGFIDNQSS